MLKPCIDCGELSTGTRCPEHAAAKSAFAYPPGWKKLRKRMKVLQPMCQCLGCNLHSGPCMRPSGHLDHIVPAALGGTVQDGVQMLCGPCNRSKGGRL